MSYAIIGLGKIGQALAKAFARSGAATCRKKNAGAHPMCSIRLSPMVVDLERDEKSSEGKCTHVSMRVCCNVELKLPSLRHMRTLLVLLLLSVSSAASAIVIRHDVDNSKYRVSAAEFPALVDLRDEGHGVLIAPQWVVTAAHALRYISVAEVTLNGLPRKVERVVVHPGYKELPQSMIDEALKSGDASKVVLLIDSSADLALIKLAQPVVDVAPALLYRGEDELGRIVKLIGKGATGTGVNGQNPHAPHRTALRRAYNAITTVDDQWLGYVFDKGPSANKLEGMGATVIAGGRS